ncbi:hypothetical protein pVa21_052 [Vibrio phage pVa-21]|nr:hypothetical protein pVa21_052 [Vibrio phage pVa-21]
MSLLRKGIVLALKKKMVKLRANPSNLIMLCVQEKLADEGYTATAHAGLLAVVKEGDDKPTLTVFELKAFPALNHELFSLTTEVRKYAGRDGKDWSAFAARAKIVLEVPNYIPTRDEVTEFGYKHLTNEGNAEGKKYNNEDVVQAVYDKVIAEL